MLTVCTRADSESVSVAVYNQVVSQGRDIFQLPFTFILHSTQGIAEETSTGECTSCCQITVWTN